MTNIEWTHRPGTKGESWNPIVAYGSEGRRGWYCEKVSDGCKLCYAEARNKSGRCNFGTLLPFTPASRKKVRIELHEPTLLKPLHWREPRTIFVCSMTDLYGDWVPFDWLDRIKAIEALCPQHTFIELTKRPERVAEYMTQREIRFGPFSRKFGADQIEKTPCDKVYRIVRETIPDAPLLWPLPNIMLGTSVENQEQLNKRLHHIMECPAAVTFLSTEPLLGSILIPETFLNPLRPPHGKVDHPWVIVGCESKGTHAGRFADEYPKAASSIIDQCRAAGVPVFHKQMPINGRVSHDMSKWPEDLRVREWPAAATAEQTA